ELKVGLIERRDGHYQVVEAEDVVEGRQALKAGDGRNLRRHQVQPGGKAPLAIQALDLDGDYAEAGEGAHHEGVDRVGAIGLPGDVELRFREREIREPRRRQPRRACEVGGDPLQVDVTDGDEGDA